MINFADFNCYDPNVQTILGLVRTLINLIKFGVPVLLIIFGMLDLGKAVIAGKEDEMKKSQGALIKRFIYAVAVFLVVVLVQFVISLVSDDDSWYNCLYPSADNVNITTGPAERT